LQYCRAISCLRKRGYSIQNRLETIDGTRHGFYRLAPIRPQNNPELDRQALRQVKQAIEIDDLLEQRRLFAEPEPARWRDPEEAF
jgi:hypothetical protein